MWVALTGLFVAILMLNGQQASGAPTMEWQEKYLDKEYAAELYNLLQNYLNEENGVPQMMALKRNSEIINSLLALPKSMSEIGR